MSPGMVLLLFVAYLWIFVLGLVGNIMVMVVVLTRYTDKIQGGSDISGTLSKYCMRFRSRI